MPRAVGVGASPVSGVPAARASGDGFLEDRRWVRGGLHLRELSFAAPLDHSGQVPGDLRIFARIFASEAESTKPYLVFFQGGPGVEAPRPSTPSTGSTWVDRALEEFQVIMVDQRGTGKSSPLAAIGGSYTGLLDANGTPEPVAIAAQLRFYRADAIVEDAEILRGILGVETWSVLGQSFGGFTTLRYVSAHAESLAEVYFTGGLPAVGVDPAAVYATTWAGMITKSEQYYRAFPGDRDRLARLADLADAEGGLVLPGGARASRERIRLLGHYLGASDGPEKLHYLLDLDPASAALRHDLAGALPFSGRNPLYAVIHESCWADGAVTNWAARRAMPESVAADETLLAGEHAGPESFVEDPELAPFAEVADLLATEPWPRLYDPRALAAAEVRGAAAVYYEDAYVPIEYSMDTVGLLSDVRPWVTNEYEHNGLRADGYRVLDRLIGLARG